MRDALANSAAKTEKNNVIQGRAGIHVCHMRHLGAIALTETSSETQGPTLHS